MRAFAVTFTPRAERQLADLYTYIAVHSTEARAEAFVGEIVADCLSLANFPERGTKRDDIRLGLRVKGHARRVSIAFSINMSEQVVAIHGVFYGGQDFERALRENGENE